MGFWAKINVFSSRPPTAQASTDAGGVGVATKGTSRIDTAPPKSDRVTDPPLSRLVPVDTPDDDQIHVPRNRQELFEELQRNYREVVDLVRRVNTHLDREQQRSERLMVIAERVEQLVPRLHELPNDINTHATHLNRELVQVIRDTNVADERRTQRLENALTGISKHLSTGSSAQAELVHTMAAFRETMSDLAQENARTGEVLRDTSERAAERERDMVKLLAGSRMWSRVGLGLSVVVGLAAVGAAVAAILLATG